MTLIKLTTHKRNPLDQGRTLYIRPSDLGLMQYQDGDEHGMFTMHFAGDHPLRGSWHIAHATILTMGEEVFMSDDFRSYTDYDNFVFAISCINDLTVEEGK